MTDIDKKDYSTYLMTIIIILLITNIIIAGFIFAAIDLIDPEAFAVFKNISFDIYKIAENIDSNTEENDVLTDSEQKGTLIPLIKITDFSENFNKNGTYILNKNNVLETTDISGITSVTYLLKYSPYTIMTVNYSQEELISAWIIENNKSDSNNAYTYISALKTSVNVKSDAEKILIKKMGEKTNYSVKEKCGAYVLIYEKTAGCSTYELAPKNSISK
ncbi:MAG: hypothetical protein IJ736_05585 [Firmicutes bacterium]|nr:hypothetical protein [Bacillota bacterium]